MEWIKKHLDLTVHPIISFILEKESIVKHLTQQETQFVPQYFNDLPSFDKSKISLIDDNLKNTDNLEDAFSPVFEQLKWDKEKHILLLEQIKKDEKSNKYNILSLLYSLLSYTVRRDIQKTNEDLLLILISMLEFKLRDYEKAVSVMFIYVITDFIDDDSFVWDKQAFLQCLCYIGANMNITPKLHPFLFHFISKVINYDEINTCNMALDYVIRLYSDDIKRFSKSETITILSMIDLFIKNLNNRALMIVAFISRAYPNSFDDTFGSLSSFFVQNIISHDASLIEDNFVTSEVPETNLSSFDFHECDKDEFENGFMQIDKEKLETDKTYKDFTRKDFDIVGIADSLSNASPKCIDLFFLSLARICSEYEGTKYFYSILTYLICTVSYLAKKTSVLQLSNLLLSETIFKPEITVFSENGVPDILKFLRTKVIFILAISAPSLIGDLIIQTSSFPFLCCEVFALTMNSNIDIDYRNFTSEECLKAISFVIDSLWSSFDNNKVAFHTTMSFVFRILADEEAQKECFGSFPFTQVFTSLCVEKRLTQTISQTIRNFLSVCGRSTTDAISQALRSIYKKCANSSNTERALEVALEWGTTLVYSFIQNPQLITFFDVPLDSILECSLLKSSEKVLQQALRMFSLIGQVNTSFILSANRFKSLCDAIHTIEEESLLHQSLLALINICGCSNSISEDQLFIIRNYTFIPVFLAGFGCTKLSGSIIPYLEKLCDHSPHNCAMMHDSGIDTILFDYILNKDDHVTFRGYNFSLNFPDKEILFELLWKIERIKSSNSIAMRCIKLMVDPPNVEMASKILDAQYAETSDKIIEFPLGMKEPFAVLRGLPSRAFNTRISMCFYIKVDCPLARLNKNALTITKITNGAQTFHLFISLGIIYFSFDNTEDPNSSIPQTVLAKLQSNDSIFIAFVHQRGSPGKSAVGLYYKNQMEFCKEVNKMQFDIDTELTLELGGNGDNSSQDIAKISTFAFHKGLLTDDKLDAISQRGDDPFTSEEGFYFTSNQVTTVPAKITAIYNEKEMEGEVFYTLKHKNPLYCIFARGNHLYAFIQCFNLENTPPDGFLSIVIGMFKCILGNYPQAQKNFAGFSLIGKLLMRSPEKLTYQMYTAFYSIFDILKAESCIMDLFKGIIMNIKLWIHTSFLPRVVNHWKNIVITQFPNIFRKKGFFSTLLGKLDCIMNVEKIDNDKICKDFISLLQQTGRMRMTAKDFEYLLALLLSHLDNIKFSVTLLKLVEYFASQFSKTDFIESYKNMILSILTNDNLDIIIGALKALYMFTFPNCSEIMLAASIQLNRHPNKSEIVRDLCAETMQFPAFYTLISILCLSLPYDDKELCAAMLKCLTVIEGNSFVTGDELWFMWPVLLTLHLKGEAYGQILVFLKHFANESTKNIHTIIEFIQLITGLLKKDENNLSIDLLKDYKGLSAKELAMLCFRVVFFRFCDISIDPLLLEAYRKSPFYSSSYELLPEKTIETINDALALDSLFQQNLDNYSLRFGISVSENSNGFEEGMLDVVASLDADFDCVPKFHSFLNELVNKTPKQDNLLTFDVSGASKHFSNLYRPALLKMIKRIHETIIKAKQRIQEALSISRFASTLRNDVPINMNAVSDYIQYMVTLHINECIRQPSTHLTHGFAPNLTHLIYNKSFEQFLYDERSFVLSDIDYTDRGIVSIPATQHILGKEDLSVCIFFSKGKIQIISINNTLRIITSEDISFVIPRETTSFEVFLKDNESLLFDFFPLTCEEMNIHFQSVDDSLIRSNVDIVDDLFKEMRIFSKFKSLMTIELFTGKSCNIKGATPLLKYKDLDYTPYQEFCFFDSFDKEKIAQNRLSLEKEDITAHLMPFQKYMDTPKVLEETKVFGLGVLPDEFLLSVFINNELVIFTTDGTKVFSIDDDLVQLKAKHNFILPEFHHIATNDGKVIVVDRKTKKLTRINTAVESEYIKSVPDFIAVDDGEFVKVKYMCSVYTRKIIAHLPEKVVCISVNKENEIFAAGTDSCNVFIQNIVKNEIFAVIETKKEPVRILITNCIAAVIVDTDGLISVYTTTGKLLGEIKAYVVSWATFSHSGVDYVIFSDSSHIIRAFAPIQPNKIKIIGMANDNIDSLSFIRNITSICGVSISGRLKIFPFHFE